MLCSRKFVIIFTSRRSLIYVACEASFLKRFVSVLFIKNFNHSLLNRLTVIKANARIV